MMINDYNISVCCCVALTIMLLCGADTTLFADQVMSRIIRWDKIHKDWSQQVALMTMHSVLSTKVYSLQTTFWMGSQRQVQKQKPCPSGAKGKRCNRHAGKQGTQYPATSTSNH